MSRWIRFLPAALFPLTLGWIMYATPMAQTVEVVRRSGISGAHHDGQMTSALTAFVENTVGVTSSDRRWGCLMVQTHGGGRSGLTDKGCGPLTVTTDPISGSAQVSGVVQSEVFNADGVSLGRSSISVDATSTGAGPAPSVCERHDVLIDPVQQIEIRAGSIRVATVGWVLISQQLGRHVAPHERTDDRVFFIDETGVIRASSGSMSTDCPEPLGN